MHITEFRIVMPFSLEEMQVGHLYSTAKTCLRESSGKGEGVEVLLNVEFDSCPHLKHTNGRHTKKVYHLQKKLPSFVQMMMPRKAMFMREDSWKAGPETFTCLSTPMLESFRVTIHTMLVEGDRGHIPNVFELTGKPLRKRHVEHLDLIDSPERYREDEDPTRCGSRRAGGRPALRAGWQASSRPVLTAYKLVTVEVPYFGWGGTVERWIATKGQRNLLLETHRRIFCWQDEWLGLTLTQLRRLESDMYEEMNASTRGTRQPGRPPLQLPTSADQEVSSSSSGEAAVASCPDPSCFGSSSGGGFVDMFSTPPIASASGPQSRRTSAMEPSDGAAAAHATPARPPSRPSSFTAASPAVPQRAAHDRHGASAGPASRGGREASMDDSAYEDGAWAEGRRDLPKAPGVQSPALAGAGAGRPGRPVAAPPSPQPLAPQSSLAAALAHADSAEPVSHATLEAMTILERAIRTMRAAADRAGPS